MQMSLGAMRLFPCLVQYPITILGTITVVSKIGAPRASLARSCPRRHPRVCDDACLQVLLVRDGVFQEEHVMNNVFHVVDGVAQRFVSMPRRHFEGF